MDRINRAQNTLALTPSSLLSIPRQEAPWRLQGLNLFHNTRGNQSLFSLKACSQVHSLSFLHQVSESLVSFPRINGASSPTQDVVFMRFPDIFFLGGVGSCS